MAPAAARNQAPLTAVLDELLPSTGRVLEIASGTGQHVTHWARTFPGVTFQPTEADPQARASILAWRAHACAPNLLPPLGLDVATPGWWNGVSDSWDAIIAVNLTHIAPWSATLGLLEGAAALLNERGRLALYGPFAENGVLAPESNRQFDATLRAQNPAWGVRDTIDVAAAASALSLIVASRIAMPANNLVLILERAPCG